MGTSTAKSPPTARVMDVLATLADSPNGRTSAELAKTCGISTSTCALVLAELERRSWVTRPSAAEPMTGAIRRVSEKALAAFDLTVNDLI